VSLRACARSARLTPVALLPPAAFGVHQLRYVLAYGGHSSVILERTGHSYMHSVVPWIALLVAIVVGCFLRALGRTFAGHTSVPRYGLSFLAMWLACTASLVAIFASQELLEGLFATGHATGSIGIFGYGGWWAIPAAACIGLVLAVALHGARWVLREVAQLASRRGARRAEPAPLVRHPCSAIVAPLAPLVGGWSGRGPPR
jgi:hypothetical protein